MLEFVSGKIVRKEDDLLILQSGGFGYKILCTKDLWVELPAVNLDVVVFVELIVREEQWTLYGFVSDFERWVFHSLLKVSGIGPKSAWNVLRCTSHAIVFRAIVADDHGTLSSMPGFSKKKANGVIAELKDLFMKKQQGRVVVDNKVENHFFGIQEEVRMSLGHLGYSNIEIMKMFAILEKQEPRIFEESEAAEVTRRCLRLKK